MFSGVSKHVLLLELVSAFPNPTQSHNDEKYSCGTTLFLVVSEPVSLHCVVVVLV